MKSEFYRLVITRDENDNIHEISLFITDSDGNTKDEVGLKDAKELYMEQIEKINKRLKNQKSDAGPVSDAEKIHKFDYPDSQLN